MRLNCGFSAASYHCLPLSIHNWKPSPTHIMSWCGVPVSWCVVKATVEPSAAGNVARKLTEEVLCRDLVGTSFCLVFMSIRRICVLLISLLEVQYKSYSVLSLPAENLFLIRVVSLERFDSQVLVPILKTVPQIMLQALQTFDISAEFETICFVASTPSEALSYMKASVVMLGPTETAQYAGSTSGSKDSWSWVARCAGGQNEEGSQGQRMPLRLLHLKPGLFRFYVVGCIKIFTQVTKSVEPTAV